MPLPPIIQRRFAQRYLQLPDTVPQRVKDLAARLTQGATSPYDKALRLQEYLRVTYPYKLDVPAPPPDRDVADYFLFDAPGGFCSYYATAMAVMLRSQGVPARVVAGFATGEYDGLLRKYRVPAKAAHAWVEVYFPDLRLDRIRTDFFARGIRLTPARKQLSPIGCRNLQQSRSAESALTPIVIGALSALLLGLIGVAAYMRVAALRAVAFDAGDASAEVVLGDAAIVAARSALRSALSATPAEFRAACADRLAGQPRLRQAVEVATELYIRAVFTSTPPDRLEVETVRQAWRTAWKERLRLRWQRLRLR